MSPWSKKLTLLSVKYGPSLMGLTCAFKILFLNLSEHDHTIGLVGCNITNLILNFAILAIFYVQGMALGYCKIHRKLCYAAAFGYLYYLTLIIIQLPKSTVLPITISYSIFMVIYTIYYGIITHFRHNVGRCLKNLIK